MSFSKSSTAYQTDCVSIQTDGYIVIKIWDTKAGKSYKSEQSRKDAVHALLFSGISGSKGCATQEPLLKKTEDFENFQKIEKEFFSKNGRWVLYTRSSSIETTLPEGIGEKNWKVYQVVVSKGGLKKYLEDQKIIKSLNTGF
ncbi:hypothetical protein [Flavobacterium sp.]|jgi:hypothetical protein|uniref:hypothetical protein n=1 Tax=Flavobacterium sp. TaxID=239 RepID=UPI0037BE8338